ncbi:MAG: DNA primase [Bacteroidia bacterium]
MISPQVIDKVFDAAAIEEVVGEYVNLKKAGANYKGLCPFHDDKHPSMSVSPAKGIFKCFSCGQGGNSVHFIMEHEGLSYPMAIKFLADKYNIAIEEGEIDVQAIEEESRRKEGLYVILEFAKNFFHQRLMESQEGKVIYQPYLKERGIRQDTINKFQLGLGSKGRTDLIDSALTNGYTVQQLFDAGLAKKIDEDQGVIQSNLRDAFIERVMFPIQNLTGKVVGFGGRIIRTDAKAPKYINSPETIIYEKRKVLYGLNHAKNPIRKLDHAFIVEGYMDVLSLSQAGIENVVAVSGTAFTEEQAKLLKRFTPEASLLFDGDEAGVNASLKHINTLLSHDINTSVVIFPEGEDPDSYTQANGKEGLLSFVEDKQMDFVHFIASVKLKGEDPVAKANSARLIAESIAQIPDPLKRAAFISEGSKLLGWQERVLNEEANKIRVQQLKQGNKESYVPQESFSPQPPPEIVEDKKNYQEWALLKSLILYSDKEFNEEQDVASFIFNELIMEEIWPETEVVKQVMHQAHEHWKENETLDQMFFVRNPLSSHFAADCIAGQHTLSEGWVKNYDKFVPTSEDTYRKDVVENLNYIKLKKIEEAITENNLQLKVATTDEDILSLQTIHLRLQELKNKITAEIGAVVLK